VNITREKNFIKILRALKGRLETYSEINDYCHYFYKEVDYNSEDAKKLFAKAWKTDTTEPLIRNFILLLEQVPIENFNKDTLLQLGKQFIDSNTISNDKIYLPLRWLVTASTKGVGIPEILEILGKDRTLSRIHTGLKWIHDTQKRK